MTKDYFSEYEFRSATPPCLKSDMNKDTLKRFNVARELAGIPFKINSAYRTIKHEKKNGRTGTSSHTKGRAMDIFAINGNARYKIITSLLKAGFSRIGVGKSFIHADDDPQKSGNVIWTY